MAKYTKPYNLIRAINPTSGATALSGFYPKSVLRLKHPFPSPLKSISQLVNEAWERRSQNPTIQALNKVLRQKELGISNAPRLSKEQILGSLQNMLKNYK